MSQTAAPTTYEDMMATLAQLMGEVRSVVEEKPWAEHIEEIRKELASPRTSLDDFDLYAHIVGELHNAMHEWTVAMATLLTNVQTARWDVLERYWVAQAD
jgi:hypothetical protein